MSRLALAAAVGALSSCGAQASLWEWGSGPPGSSGRSAASAGSGCRLPRARPAEVATRGLQFLRGRGSSQTRDGARAPALAGRASSTAVPGRSRFFLLSFGRKQGLNAAPAWEVPVPNHWAARKPLSARVSASYFSCCLWLGLVRCRGGPLHLSGQNFWIFIYSKNDFSYFWLWWIFHTVWAPWLRCVSLLLWWLLLLQSVGSRHRASVAVARGLSSVGPGLQSTDLVTPSHVRSSQIRDQSPISYVGRWILYH